MIFYLTFLFNIVNAINIIKLNTGFHLIKPEDYNYNKQIIVEMWGGGASGNACNGNGGGSGGYIKAILNTNNDYFNITVGSGGDNNYNIYNDFIDNYILNKNSNGSSTIIMNNYVYLSAGGGQLNKGGINDYNNHNINIINNINGNDNYQIRLYQDVFMCPIYLSPYSYYNYYTNYGGNAPYGGSGGRGTVFNCALINHKTSDKIECLHKIYNLQTDGSMPGGGGGGTGINKELIKFIDNNNKSCIDYYCGNKTKGGDGLVFIYYN